MRLILGWILLFSTALMASEVPLGSVADSAVNFQQQSEHLATAGKLKPGAPELLKQEGFKTVIDLRTVPEGVAEERDAVTEAGMVYYNLPVDGAFPDESTRAAFEQLLNDETNYPILLHCGSANRVGMLWSAYQIDRGVDFETALEEGRRIGMKPSREEQLKDHYQAQSNE